MNFHDAIVRNKGPNAGSIGISSLDIESFESVTISIERNCLKMHTISIKRCRESQNYMHAIM